LPQSHAVCSYYKDLRIIVHPRVKRDLFAVRRPTRIAGKLGTDCRHLVAVLTVAVAAPNLQISGAVRFECDPLTVGEYRGAKSCRVDSIRGFGGPCALPAPLIGNREMLRPPPVARANAMREESRAMQPGPQE